MQQTLAPHHPAIPLKDMDPAMLAFELTHELNRLYPDNSLLRNRVLDAAMAATFLHRNQTRMVRQDFPRVPYIEHPLRNALRLIRWGFQSHELIIAALLHDVVEDCALEIATVYLDTPEAAAFPEYRLRALSLLWLRNRYSPLVSDTVHRVSNPIDGVTTYSEHLVHLTAGGVDVLDALVVKASDLVDNAGSLWHQLGAVPNAFIIKMVLKYTPSVNLVLDALIAINAELPAHRSDINNAIEALDLLQAQLVELTHHLKIEHPAAPAAVPTPSTTA